MTTAPDDPDDPDDPGAAPRRGRRLLAQTAGLVAVHFLVPVAEPSTGRARARGLAAALLLVVVLAYVVRTVSRQVRTADADVRIDRLVLAAVAGIVAFALADHVIAHADPDQFAGLETKSDALYFAVTTLSTVGYGDVHPAGQLARQVVTGQLVFNLVVLAAAARTPTRGLAGHSRRQRRAEQAVGDRRDPGQPGPRTSRQG